MRRTILISAACLMAANVQAHHSPNLHFMRDRSIEVYGVLTQADWQNPHTQLTISSTDDDGNVTEWLIEGRSASQYVRAGVTRETFQVGEMIQIAGFPGRRNPRALFATNILLADGRELVTDNFVEPRWSASTAVMLTQRNEAQPVPAAADVEGIFRVWGRDRSDHGIEGTGRTLWLDSYPLTEDARNVRASWDRIDDNPYINCGNGMPAIMDLGTPMEFVREGGDVVLYLEEQDSVRRIHMTDSAVPAGTAASPFGYSVGRWDGETLEVSTTRVSWPWFDQTGIPQSDAATFVERFTPSEDGEILRYRITVTDPATFTEPVELDRVWVWERNDEVRPYNCVWNRDDL